MLMKTMEAQRPIELTLPAEPRMLLIIRLITAGVTARATVDRPMPRSRATCRCGTPSATSRRIKAQSSTEITHPICLGGLVFDRRYGLIFKRRRHRLMSLNKMR